MMLRIREVAAYTENLCFIDSEKNRADGLTKKVPTGALIRVFGSVNDSHLEAAEAETEAVTAQATRFLSC